MPRVHLNQTSFTSGELSPEMRGRVDIDRWQSGADTISNLFVRAQGGLQRRDGSTFSGEVEDSTKYHRVVPFVFNRNQAYCLVFGDNTMRVYNSDGSAVMDGLNPYEVATPYSSAEVEAFDYAQTADTMYIASGTKPIYRVRRFADDYWTVTEAPFVNEPTGEFGRKPAAGLTLSAATVGTGRTITADASVFLASDVGRQITSQSGLLEITAFTSGTVVTGEIKVAFDGTSLASGEWVLEGSPQATCTPSAYTPVGTACTLTLSADGWRSDDVGSIVSINSGVVQITAYTSATVVSGEILIELSSAAAAPALGWELQTSFWSATNGYPSCLAFHQQRLFCSGVSKYPRHVFASKIGNTLDFLIGTSDDDAFAFPVADAQEIRSLASVRDLVALDYSGEFVIQGGVEKPITPTNVSVKNHSFYGASGVKPIRWGNELYFTQRSGKKLRAFAYRYTEDIFDAPEMTKLAQHITDPGIREMAFQQEPYGRMLFVLNNGSMGCLTIDRTEAVVGWSRFSTQGTYESICCVPDGDVDAVFVIVRRPVGAGYQRHIERWSLEALLDSQVTKTGTGFTTVTGLGHMEGQTVKVIADGMVQTDEVVSSGSITLTRPADVAVVGRGFTPTLKMLPVEFPTGQGTAQGANTRVGEVIVRFYQSGTVEVDGSPVGVRKFTVTLDEPADLLTGDVAMSRYGWKRTGGDIEVTQPIPGPLHILSVVRRVTVND